MLDVWYLHAYPGRDNPLAKIDPKSRAVIGKTLAKALRTDNRKLLPKVAERGRNGSWKLREDPPVLTRVDAFTKARVLDGLNRYTNALPRERASC